MKQRHIVLSVNSHGVARCLCGATWENGTVYPRCPASQFPTESELLDDDLGGRTLFGEDETERATFDSDDARQRFLDRLDGLV